MSVLVADLVRRGSSHPAGTAMMAHEGAVYRCKVCDAEIIVKDVDDFEKRDEAAAERHECK